MTSIGLSKWRPAVLLLLITVIFNWRTLLTRQFTLLSEAEGVNQGYSWLVFCIHRIRHFQLPGWDPFTFAGRSFVGEMQTSAFSPFNLLLAAIPLNRHGLVYPYAYNVYIAVLHFLAACFMYLLARELKQSRFASLLAAVCFSCGGFFARVGWPDMMQSCIWLPLTFLFVLRAFRLVRFHRAAAWRNSAYCGLTIGLGVLGGRLHIVMMQAIVVITAAAYYAWRETATEPVQLRSSLLHRALPIAGIAALFAFGVGAIQLLPSIEYSPYVIRAIGPTAIAAKSVIPYTYLGGNILSPHGLLTILFPFGFNGANGIGERLSPYMGVFPMILVCIGIAFNWRNHWVRYFFFLALLSFLYAMGPFFGLHGFLYALVPWLWMLREPTRLLYLTGFGMAILAGFGADALLAKASNFVVWRGAIRVFTAVVAVFAVALVPSLLFNKPELNNWVALSLVLVFLSYGLFRYIVAGHSSRAIEFVIIAFILVDLSPFDWTARNKTELEKSNSNYLERLVSCDGAVRFLKSQPGPFRVQVEDAQPPNIGDAFGIYTTGGTAATFVYTTGRLKSRLDLFNVEYLMKPAKATDPNPVYADSDWKIYRNPAAFPHAWLVHQIDVQPTREDTLYRIDAFKAGDLRSTAFIKKPLSEPLGPPSGQPEAVTVTGYGIDHMSLSVESHGRALLVLSENSYPGWQATVNGRPTAIHEVDGGLRGIVVPDGASTVALQYAPWSIRIGAILSLAALLSLAAIFIFVRD
ncbi:MAG TPA: YfhO family protein [Bryobacteraceae bacterium]|nr:YfhO family protein [Bryobacteraceae bacterium]